MSYIEVNINIYTVTEIKKSNQLIKIPKEPVFLQKNNREILIAIIPVMNQVVIGEVQFLEIIALQHGIVLNTRIPIFSAHIAQILDNSWKDISNPLDVLKRQVLMFLKHEYLNVKYRNDTIPCEVFITACNKQIDALNEIIINI